MKLLPKLGFLLLVIVGPALATPPTEKTSFEKENVAHLYMAYRISLFQGAVKKATRYLEKAIEKSPDDESLLMEMASLKAAQGDLETAKGLCQRLEGSQDSSLPATTLLAKIASAEGDHAQAIRYFQKAYRKDPDAEEIVFQLTQEQAAQKNFTAALTLLNEFHRRHPKETNSLFYKASLYLHFMNKPYLAIATYKEILKIEPDNLKASSVVADIYITQGKKKEALKTLAEMEKENPDDISLHLKEALLHYEMKNYPAAILQFRKILDQSPNYDKITYYLGVIYENTGKVKEAKAEFEKILPPSDFYKEARLHIAYLTVQDKKEDEALAILHEAIQKRADIGEFYEYISEIERDRGELDKGIAILKEGLKKAQDKSRLYYAIGVLYDKNGDYKKAIQSMRKVLKLSPTNAHAMNFIGYTYAERDIHLDEAEKLVKKALELKPEDGYITDSLGWVYFRKGDLDEAFRYVGRAYQMIPQEPTIVEHLGDLYLQKSGKETALRYFQESLVLLSKKKEPDAEKEMERLKQKIERLKVQP